MTPLPSELRPLKEVGRSVKQRLISRHFTPHNLYMHACTCLRDGFARVCVCFRLSRFGANKNEHLVRCESLNWKSSQLRLHACKAKGG